jgi:hypothetical protein
VQVAVIVSVSTSCVCVAVTVVVDVFPGVLVPVAIFVSVEAGVKVGLHVVVRVWSKGDVGPDFFVHEADISRIKNEIKNTVRILFIDSSQFDFDHIIIFVSDVNI